MSKEKTEGLEPKKIYSYSELTEMGYEFGILSINRETKDRSVSKKSNSINTAGIISPCLVVPAQQCVEQGLGIKRKNSAYNPDNPASKRYLDVDTSNTDIDNLLIIIDGQHRHIACENIRTQLEEAISGETNDESKKALEGKKAKAECYYCLPIHSDVEITTILREANICTMPWGGSDYLTTLILNPPIEDDKEHYEKAVLIWIYEHKESLGDTAAWYWARLETKSFPKGKLSAASTNEVLYKDVASNTNFELGKRLFEVALKTLGSRLVKLKIVPETLIGMINQNPKVARADVVKDLETFLGRVSSTDREEMERYKNDKTTTKDSKIRVKLEALWKEYKEGKSKATPTPPTPTEEEPSHDEVSGDAAESK